MPMKKNAFAHVFERLDEDDIEVRNQAGQELLKIGAVAEPFLAEAMKTGKIDGSASPPRPRDSETLR